MIVSCTLVRPEPDRWLPLMVRQTSCFVDLMVFVLDSPAFEGDRNYAVIKDLGDKARVLWNHVAREDKGYDGHKRNLYLQYLKENYMGSLAVVIDTDEVLDDRAHALREVEKNFDFKVSHIRMHHYFWNLGFEDSTLNEHWTPTRVFRVAPDLHYYEVEHPVLRGNFSTCNLLDIPLHHYGGLSGIWSEADKYRRQVAVSNIHTPDDLLTWHERHIAGGLPVKRVVWGQHPAIVREAFKQ